MKEFQSVLDSGLGVLDRLQDDGMREVMSTEETIQPSSRNANEARLFAIEASEAMETLRGFCLGRPVVIEEIFPLKCSIGELERFFTESREYACGWIGFYWGKTPEEYRQRGRMGDVLILGWLEFFQTQANRTGGQTLNPK